MMRFFSTLVFSMILAASPLAARVDFSGSWKAITAESDFGSLGAPAEFVRAIEEDGLRLIINVTSKQDGETTTGELRFSLDGEKSENSFGQTTVSGFAREVGDHMLVVTNRDMDGMPTEIVEIWSLSPDGKTLQVDAVVSTRMGNENLRVVFGKQD